ncbi:MAG: tetraacyldisaccharide 4'-kinase [Acidobacteria bacterium]|nr:MAG: tetraacyldisaccharide 4'-kinase [Acidobacteriota bacterium]
MSYALAPLGVIYGAATRARLALYRAGALPVHKIAAPVISIGNITAGGTGKTPLVEWLARAAAREGRRVCVLTRGYGRAHARQRVVVSDGQNVLADARAGGDEPRLLAENLRGLAAVVADADRFAAARWAIKELKSDLFILDDGFQHLRLARDLNLVTLDASAPWGGGHLLPRGRLREPLAGLKRADCLIITRAELANDLEGLRATAAQLSAGRPIFNARTSTQRIRLLTTNDEADTFALDALVQPLMAFCAIGNPQAFFTHARNAGYDLSQTRVFPDHHNYTQTDVDALTRAAAQHGARALITTAKDAVKLRSLHFSLPCFVLEIALMLEDEASLLALVRRVLS